MSFQVLCMHRWNEKPNFHNVVHVFKKNENVGDVMNNLDPDGKEFRHVSNDECCIFTDSTLVSLQRTEFSHSNEFWVFSLVKFT